MNRATEAFKHWYEKLSNQLADAQLPTRISLESGVIKTAKDFSNEKQKIVSQFAKIICSIFY